MSFFENYNDTLNQLQSYGLQVSDLQVDTTRPVRCPVDTNLCPVDPAKRRSAGWYHLASFVIEQKTYIVGAYGFWKGADNNQQKIAWDKTIEITPEQKKAQAARIKQMQAQAKKQRAEEVAKASQRAQWIWSKYSPAGESDYLHRKQVGAHGVRFGPHNTVAVPIADANGKLFGLQLIRSDAAIAGTKKIQKKFEPAGLAVSGHFHLIGSPREVVMIAEGYATAATIHETTSLPIAVAFNANNITPTAQALRKAYPTALIVVCADDDYLTEGNPGVAQAEKAVNTVGGRMVKPDFTIDGVDIRNGAKLTDFNDLACHQQGGPHLVRAQIEAVTKDIVISTAPAATLAAAPQQGEGVERPKALSIMPIEDIVQRFLYVDDDAGETCFDRWTRKMVRLKKVQSLLPAKTRWDEVKGHPVWMTNAVYIDQVGFDPTEKDKNILCNMWSGWPIQPKQGSCDALLMLLKYLCAGEENALEVFDWVMKWLAYPLQNPGAKMQSAIVVHGPQGTGKSLFFEVVGKIYGEYGIVLNQGAIEDKFNSDWTSKKLYVVADEVVANAEKHHLKNQLKALVTGEWIRVNPKNVAAHKEKNQMNMVFLSNEKQPVVLENDDRRHCVIWTPPKLKEDHYEKISAEVENGGVEALYHHLLNLDLEDFKPWTKPPMTKSKSQLIDINRDTVDAFIEDWLTDGLGYPVGPVMSSDLYRSYQHWCQIHGEKYPRSAKVFNAHIDKLTGWYRGYKSRFEDMNYVGSTKRARVIIPSEESSNRAQLAGIHVIAKTADKTESQYVTDGCMQFTTAYEGITK